MSLREIIENNYKQSIKDRDQDKTNTLRLIKSAIKDKDIAAALKLPPIKLHCSVLAEGSIKAAIEDWETKNA